MIVAWANVRQWMRQDDDARDDLEDIQRHIHIVPPWTRAARLTSRVRQVLATLTVTAALAGCLGPTINLLDEPMPAFF